MICPYCNQEMTKGIMSGDGRVKVRWKAGDKVDRVDSVSFLGCSYSIQAVKYPALAGFRLETYYCKSCGKMIFDTTISE